MCIIFEHLMVGSRVGGGALAYQKVFVFMGKRLSGGRTKYAET